MYNELCEKLAEQHANNYMAVFNELDKYFDTLVESDRGFMPFNEKVKHIAQDTWTISAFVRKYEQKLKYFGELRNHIAHGFKLDGKHYATPSYHGVEELRKVKEAIVKPVTISSVYEKKVYTCVATDSLKDVMIAMKNFGYTHVPVYDEKHTLLWVMTQSAICEWLAYHMQDASQSLESVTVSAVDLNAGIERYALVEQDKPLFAVAGLFEPTWLHHKILWALLITKNGKPEEDLLWIVTTYDLPAVTEYNFIA
jgi:predicted transcriptional regulator